MHEKTISFKLNELECRLDILSSDIDTAISLQSDLDLYDPTNDDRADLEDICVTM